MFKLVKQGVNLRELIEKDLSLPLRESGDNLVIEDERDHGGCPFCSHNDCFKVKHNDDDLESSFYHCFSCEAHGDVIGWRAARKGIKPVDAARELAKEYDIQIPADHSPLQEIFTLAAAYYENCFWEECNKPYPELAGRTPLEYQTDVRRHSKGSLKHFQVGWSDGGLIEYLESIGIDDELLIESGLKSKKTGRDFLPSKVFIYPHIVRGRVSHFTFKDPLKKIAYQLPKKATLNGWLFYNQDSIKLSDTVLIVEGENDLISVWDTRKVPAVIGTIGQISKEQLEWMRDNLKDKKIVTLFDPDDAGDKYRIKVEKNRPFLKQMVQVLPPDGKDIDDHLREGADLSALIRNNIVKVDIHAAEKEAKAEGKADDLAGSLDIPWEEVSPPSTPESFSNALAANGLGLPGQNVAVSPEGRDESYLENLEIANNHVIQRKGCYYKVKMKDGVPDYLKISNFCIKLLNVFVNEDGDRNREIVIIKENGFSSDPQMINSETKVSLKNFRILIAKAADADFEGTEQDLTGMWKLVYAQASDTVVKVPRTVGRHSGNKGWIFRNLYISDAGHATEPDENGIFWLHGRSIGIRPESLNVNGDPSDIPRIETTLSVDEANEMMTTIVRMVSQNLNSPGLSLMILGWTYACIYADLIFSMHKGFPFLFFWGTNGKGKTTVAKWLQDFYDMRSHGSTSVPQLKSGVGWARKSEYYSCLPLMIDEVRSNDETRQYLGTFRAYYDREGRTMGAKDGFGVKTQTVRSNFIFVGEDQFEDPATRERCVPIRIPAIGRETVESYRWMEDHRHLFTGITYHWIKEYCESDLNDVKADIRRLDRLLVDAGCPARVSKNWASVGVFAQRLAERYMPEFDFITYLKGACQRESTQQKADATLMQFFELVEGIQAKENSAINNSHIMVDGNFLHIWYPTLYKIVYDETRGKFAFSKNAVLSALREEPYFVSDDRKITMGLNGVRRYVVTLDLTKAPDSVRNIAQSND